MAKAGHVYPQIDPGAAALMDRRVAPAARRIGVSAALACAERSGAHVLVLGSRIAVRQSELARAARWGLGRVRALDIAWHEVPVIASSTGEVAVRRLILAGASMLLVREGSRTVGVVDGRAVRWARPALSVAHRLEQPGEAARESVVWLLRLAGKLGEAMGVAVWAAGGFVRDLLRDSGPLDVDLVVEGDGPAFARRLADEVRGRATVHRAFGTATVEDGRTVDGAPLPRVDIATARRERYAAPGALPSVEAAPLAEDLLRRDFTINAMAIALGPAVFGRLVDAAGGERDLDRRRLAPLQPLSFVEDPTRVFRAARYVARLGFRLDAQGGRALRLCLARAYPALSGARLQAELAAILREPTGWQALAILLRWGAFRLWDRGYRAGGRTPERLRAARRLLVGAGAAGLAADAMDVAMVALLVDQPRPVARRALRPSRRRRRAGRASRRGDDAWPAARPAARRPRPGAESRRRRRAGGLDGDPAGRLARGEPRGAAAPAVVRARGTARPGRAGRGGSPGRRHSPGTGGGQGTGRPSGSPSGRPAASAGDEERFVKRESARYRKGASA